MKKTPKKLVLRSETLRALVDMDLARAVGGFGSGAVRLGLSCSYFWKLGQAQIIKYFCSLTIHMTGSITQNKKPIPVLEQAFKGVLTCTFSSLV